MRSSRASWIVLSLPSGDRFAYATGESLPSSWPELPRSREFRFPCGDGAARGGDQDREFVWPDNAVARRVKPQVRSVVKGGCG